MKKDLFLSGVRDGVRHQSSFYDNVLAWATAKLANDLGIVPIKKQDLEKWKQEIINAFWDKKAGIFLDDLSQKSKLHHIFPADAFIVTQTQFLNPAVSEDNKKLLQMISFVKKYHLDNPFPLVWSTYNQSKQMVFLDHYLVPNYEQQSLFSHWTVEYIKTILLVSDNNPEYINDSKKFVSIYNKNITKYGGYPEIYTPDGKIFTSLLYKSILHTGWIINFEQTKLQLQSVLRI